MNNNDCSLKVIMTIYTRSYFVHRAILLFDVFQQQQISHVNLIVLLRPSLLSWRGSIKQTSSTAVVLIDSSGITIYTQHLWLVSFEFPFWGRSHVEYPYQPWYIYVHQGHCSRALQEGVILSPLLELWGEQYLLTSLNIDSESFKSRTASPSTTHSLISTAMLWYVRHQHKKPRMSTLWLNHMQWDGATTRLIQRQRLLVLYFVHDSVDIAACMQLCEGSIWKSRLQNCFFRKQAVIRVRYVAGDHFRIKWHGSQFYSP